MRNTHPHPRRSPRRRRRSARSSAASSATRSAASAALAGAQAAEDFKAGFSLNASTASLVADLQSRLRANPKDEHSYALLGLAYQQRARETGDPAYYPKSEGVLRRALALDSKDYLAVSGLGSLALSRHRFREALALGEQARKLNPYSARDTRRDRRRATSSSAATARRSGPSTRMNKLRPSLSSYARVSYGRELIGHTAAAIARDEARRSTPPPAPPSRPPGRTSSSASSTSNHGRLAAAEREYRLALRIFPGYAYALDALAQVARRAGRATARRSRSSGGRRRDPAAAVRRARSATSTASPAGRRSRSAQYALIGAIERLLHANGVKTDLEIALFQVDHGIALRHALARARLAPRRAAVDRRRRRARLGARAQRPLRRGAPLLAARAPARHAGRAQVLPPRDDRALSRPRRRPRRRGSGARSTLNPHFSLLWAPVGEEATRREEARSSSWSSQQLALRAGRERAGASARQLHDQPLQPRRGLGRPRLRPLRPRPGRDPDLPGEAGGAGSTRRAYATANRRRRAPDASTAAAPGSSRSRHALAFPPGAGGLRTTRLEVVLARPAARRARAGSPTATRTTPAVSAGRRSSSGGAHVRRPSSRQRRAARVPEGPALEPARRHVASAATVAPTSRPAPGADSRPRARARRDARRRRRLREPDRSRQPQRRLRPASRC